MTGSGNFGAGGLPPGTQTAGLLSFYDYCQQPAVMTITLTGLDPNATYNLVVFSAGNQPGQSAVLSGAINGTNTLSTRDSFALGDNYAQNQSAKPDATGALVVQIANDPNQTPYGTFNGVQLQDNLVSVPSVRLTVQRSGANLLLSWPQGTLLQATNVAGPYLPVSGNPPSPYTAVPTGAQRFYRVQVSP